MTPEEATAHALVIWRQRAQRAEARVRVLTAVMKAAQHMYAVCPADSDYPATYDKATTAFEIAIQEAEKKLSPRRRGKRD